MPNFSSPGCLGARLESVTHDRQTDARQTPGEYSANSGPAGLVPGPELSNNIIRLLIVLHTANLKDWLYGVQCAYLKFILSICSAQSNHMSMQDLCQPIGKHWKTGFSD